MTRTLDYLASEALRSAVSFFYIGCHSIKWLPGDNGVQKAVITSPAGRYAGRLRYRCRNGLLPSRLPAFMVIDGDGKPVAVCHYCKVRLSDPDPEPDTVPDSEQ